MKYTKEFLLEQYDKYGTLTDIARNLGVSKQAIYKAFKRRGIKVRSSAEIAKERCSKYTYNRSFFSNIDTEEKAYWLGFVVADGSVIEKTRSMRLKIALKKSDEEHLHKFNKALDSNVPIRIKKINLGEKTHECCEVVINCTEMCRDLINIGVVPNKSCKEFIPNIRKDLIRHFVRGYFDGDGCITKKHRIKICVSDEMASDLIRELSEIGIKFPPKAIQIKKGCKIKQLEICSNANISLFLDYIYKDSSVFLARKKKISDTFTKI